MRRTDLDPATLANALRHTAGDGSIEWVHEPMQASVLLDVADLLDESAKLRELMTKMADALGIDSEWADPNWCKRPCALEFECWPEDMDIRCPAWAAMHELGVEVDG